MTICGRELCPYMAGNYVFAGLFKRLSAPYIKAAEKAVMPYSERGRDRICSWNRKEKNDAAENDRAAG